MLARLTFEYSNKLWIDWTSDDNSWFLKWLGVSADLTMLRTFFSVKTPTVCALYERLCEDVRSLKIPASARVLFEIRDSVRIHNSMMKFETSFLRTAVQIGSKADGMLQCAKHVFERVFSPLEQAPLGAAQHLQSLFMLSAAQRDMPMLRLLVNAVTHCDYKTEFKGDNATALLALVIRQIHLWDLEDPEGENTIAEYIGLLIQGGILSTRQTAWWCCEDRPEVPIWNCESLTVDELVMMCPPAKRNRLYSVILPWSNEHRIFISKAGIFNASLDGPCGLLSYLRSFKKNQGFDVHAIMQECLLFASSLNDTSTASALLGLGTDSEARLLSNNQEQYHKGILSWNPMVVAAAAGSLDVLNMLVKRVDLACFVERAPLYEIVQVENSQDRYMMSTGRELRRLENLRRHCLYSGTQISDSAVETVTVHFNPFTRWTGRWSSNSDGDDVDRAFFAAEKRRIDTLTRVRDIAMALGLDQSLDKEIITAALLNDPEARSVRCRTTTYHPCDVLLLEGLVDANIEYHEDDMDLLQLSIRAHCSLKVVEFLLSKGLRVHSRKAAQSGNTMLHDALLSQSCDRSKIVKLLLREGADYRHCGEGLTVLEASLREMSICERSDALDLFTLLFEMGAPVRQWPGSQIKPESALISGLLNADAEDELILRVLDAGAELNTRGSRWDHRTAGTIPPLQAAIIMNRERLAQELLRRGADVHARAHGSSHGSTALQIACSTGSSLQFIEYMVAEQGANVNEEPGRGSGSTALQNAANSGALSVAEFLLSYGSDVNALSGQFLRQGKFQRFRALDFAAMRGRLDMVEFLLKAGGRSGTAGLGLAIHVAGENGHFAVLSVLQDWEKENGSRIIMEEAEWQQQNPDSARMLLEAWNGNYFSAQSMDESGDSLEGDLDQ